MYLNLLKNNIITINNMLNIFFLKFFFLNLLCNEVIISFIGKIININELLNDKLIYNKLTLKFSKILKIKTI